MTRKDSSLNYINENIATDEFINKHKDKPTDFTRDRVLRFVTIFILILRKSTKSIQLVLNEIFLQGVICSNVSASAYVQARKKFRHTAFLELNEGIVGIYYSEDKIKKWKGFRCIGVDSSKIILPNTEEMKKEFGEIKIKNEQIESSYASARFVCYYDVLNRIAIKSVLASSLSYEADVAADQLEIETQDDLLIYDRGFASYKFLATLVKNNSNYLVRCPHYSFKATNSLFEKTEKEWSKIVHLKAPQDQRKRLESLGLPLEIKVRFVSVILTTGEIEVLATSIMDNSFTRNNFKEAYHLRWGVEDYYNLIKGRLALENFTGKTIESVKQDFWSTIFMTNLETIMTEEAEEEIISLSKETKYEKKINKAVSFNVIKNTVFDLLLNEKDKNNLLRKIELAFKTSPILKRSDRSPPRKKFSALRSYNFLRRIKKQVF